MVLAYGEQWDTNDQQDHCSQMLAISMGTVPMIGAKACLKVEQRSFETQSLTVLLPRESKRGNRILEDGCRSQRTFQKQVEQRYITMKTSHLFAPPLGGLQISILNPL
ncbi:uncharacterized protein N7506_009437 [Penicillium brevicompactum]|uniref:uncharacterized protein n=1 Tax=Penicillium brevicompactum TaxID=5074 RepID=UPI002540B05F|nr:uncharacterized protein N7506_009437 [Penicillium brevicompactum]KAJ5326335.1 hypothetical protein N7506_009437 [Penicillium brevicompactum]